VCVRSLLPASEKRVAADEERVGRFAKKSSCEGAMPAIPTCYMVKELASCAPYQGWVADRLAFLPEREIGDPVAPLRREGDACVATIAMALASAMIGPEGKCEPSWFWFSVPRRPFWHQIDVAMPDFRGANRERCVSYVTLRWLSKKCTCAGLNCGPRRASR
jgi:hypothetical protein